MTKMLVWEKGTTGRTGSEHGVNPVPLGQRRTSQVLVHPILIAEPSKLDNHHVPLLVFEV
jgi:hypothetical protein